MRIVMGLPAAEAAFRFQLAHTIWGFFLILIGALALLDYYLPNKKILRYGWSSLHLIGALFFLFYLTFIFSDVSSVLLSLLFSLHSNELLTHYLVDFGFVIGSCTVILYKCGILKSKHWLLSWGVANLIYGFLFIMHPQKQVIAAEGLYAIQYHQWTGGVALIIGIFFILNMYLTNRTKCFNFLWPAAVITNGFMWIFYHINPKYFHDFDASRFLQMSVENSLATALIGTLLILLLGGLLLKKKF